MDRTERSIRLLSFEAVEVTKGDGPPARVLFAESCVAEGAGACDVAMVPTALMPTDDRLAPESGHPVRCRPCPLMTDTVDKVFSDAGDEILIRGAGAAPQQRFVYVKPAI